MQPDFSRLTLRVAGIEPESIVDGPGLRLTVFTQGCPHRCPFCHNPKTHDPQGGRCITLAEILDMIAGNDLLDGVTLSGGEPFAQAAELVPLAREIKNRGLHLTIYTGYTYEVLRSHADAHPAWLDLLVYADLLVDGPFVYAQRTLDVPFKGSANQRLIDVQASLDEGRVVEWDAAKAAEITHSIGSYLTSFG